jgi:hypothetical protein
MDALQFSVAEYRKKRNDVSEGMGYNDEERRNLIETLPKSLNPFDFESGKNQIGTESKNLPPELQEIFVTLSASLSTFNKAIVNIAKEIARTTRDGDDFIRTEDGDISFFEKDTIIAGTGLNDIAKMIKGDVSPKSSELIDTMKLMNLSQSKDLNPMSNGKETNGSSNENKLVIEVRVSTSNDNINPELNQKIVDVVTQAFKDDMGLKQVVATSIKDVVTNGSRPS